MQILDEAEWNASATTMNNAVDNLTSASFTQELIDIYVNESEDHLNQSVGEWLYVPSTSSPDSLLFYVVFSTIFLLGILGNSLVLVILARHKSMRTVPNTYIMSLAVADLVTTLICGGAPLLPSWFCSLLYLPLQTVFCVTAWSLVALSVERYFAIAKPFSSHKFSVSTRTTVSVIWILSFLYSLAFYYILPPPTHTCVLMFNPSSFANTYTAIHFMVLYVMPLIVFAIFYSLLAISLYFSGSFWTKSDSKNSQIPPHIKARRRISFMVLVLVLMYAVFYFPFNYFSLRLYFDPDYAKYWDDATNIIYCVGCLHNSFNPVILYLLSESFREHFNLYFRFFTCRGTFPPQNAHIFCDCIQCIRKSSLGHTLGSPMSVKT